MRFRVANTDGQGANVRPEPGTTGAPVRRLAEGTELNGNEHAWRQVTVAGAVQGWMANEFLVNGRVARTGGSGANLRTQPDSSAERISVVAEGTEVTAAEHAWRKVFVDGTSGWIAEELLTPLDSDVWSFDLGLACSRENYWDP